jgi:hypothetical protein
VNDATTAHVFCWSELLQQNTQLAVRLLTSHASMHTTAVRAHARRHTAKAAAMSETILEAHADLTTRRLQWEKVRACLEGEEVVKQQGAALLPKPSGQTTEQYDAYRARASFYAICERTLRGLSGLVLRNAPAITVPPRLEPILKTATTDGHTMDVLVSEVLDEVMALGRYGLLVDYPVGATSTDVPSFATYKAEDIVNWRVSILNGKRVVTRVVLSDFADDDDEGSSESYLELEIVNGVYMSRHYTVDNGQPVLVSERQPTVGGRMLNGIPFVFMSPYNLKPATSKPPFLDLANMNIAHYRNSADYEHALFLTAQPTPWISGNITEADKPRSIGAGSLWCLPEGASAGMLEFSGAGLAAQRQAMMDKEDRMAALGARMIKDASTAAETAETARLRGRAETSLLASTVRMVQAGIKSALSIAAEWVGASADDVDVRLNTDFVEARLSAQELTTLVAAWQSGAISRETMHVNLQKGEIMPSDRSWEDEKDAIDMEGGGIGVTAAATIKQEALVPVPAQTSTPVPDKTQQV